MAEPGGRDPADVPADVPPPLRPAVAAALAWLEQLEREAELLRRPR